MIDLAIATYDRGAVEKLNKIEGRIIGIDGNGTGKKGALQRQDDKLEELAGNQAAMSTKLDTLLHRSKSWDKATFWKAFKWWIGLILALIGSVIGYLSYRAKTGHEISKAPTALTQNFDATLK